MTVMHDPVWDHHIDRLQEIAKAFYQAYRLTGMVIMRFGLRTMPDSDGNSVVDVYVSSRDQEAACTLTAEDSARHMQFLESMVPASLLGYEFILHIIPQGAADICIEVLEIITPVRPEVGSSGPGLTS